MANNYNSNNFMYDKKKYINKNTRITTTTNLAESNISANDPNEYQFKYYDRFDTYKGLFNTQQLIGSIDFNEFENHCFFDSAVSKTEASFNQIYDKFPLDGTKKEVDDFLLNIDGFTRNIYNQFDKNIGYLKFNNSYIEVKNESGNIFSFSRNEEMIKKIGNPVLSPSNNSFSFDFRCYISPSNIQNQIIFQYFDQTNQNGFTLFSKNQFVKNGITYANIVFLLTNYENNIKNYIESKFYVSVNKWNHIVISINKIDSISKKINVIINEKEVLFLDLLNTALVNINILDFENYKIENFLNNKNIDIPDAINFILGKGIQHPNSNFSNISFFSLNTSNNFIGYLDEFRYYHSITDQNISIKYKDKNVYANDFLKLYFKFNEPTGNHQNNSVLFDHSGNSLHSQIKLNDPSIIGETFRNTISTLREKTIGNPPLKYEENDLNPVLIPSYNLHINLNNQFLQKAKEYDLVNPNLIYKLFPRHYFLEGMESEGYSEVYRNEYASAYYQSSNENNYPGQNKKEAAQTFANLLIIWARFFDQLKLYLQILPKLIDIEYTDINQNSIVNFFIPLIAKLNGFDFKEILNSPVNKLLDGYIFGKDSTDKSAITLRYIQNEIWKRIIINSKDIISSKGTLNSIRSIFNSVGIVPEEYYRFREYGSNANKFIEKQYNNINKNFQYATFFNNIKNESSETSIQSKYYEYSKDRNFLVINHPSFNFQNYYTNDSLNFNNLTLEFLLNYNKNISQNPDILVESILKIESTGNEMKYELFFIKADEYSSTGDLYFFIRDNSDNDVQLDLNNLNEYPCIKNINLLDGSYWQFTIQFIKSIPNINENNKILINLQRAGSLNEYDKKYEILYEIDSSINLNIFTSTNNKILFGSKKCNSLYPNSKMVGSLFPKTGPFSNINNNSLINKFSKITTYTSLYQSYIKFNGNISFIKMWKTKNELKNEDLLQHAMDPQSLSLNRILLNKDDIKNYLLLDLSLQDKNLTVTSNGNKYNCKLIDYSQNIKLDDINYNDIIDYGYINSVSNLNLLDTFNNKSLNIKKFDIKFDEINELNKVKISGYFDENLIKDSNEDLQISPVFQYDNIFYKGKSDIRFSIEMSNVKHLNEDMSNLLSTVESFSNMISDFSQLNESEYIDLNKISDLYFKRITSTKLNITALYEVYQIFDNILTELLSNFVASRVKFNNNIYVIESHAFERHKYYYKFLESQNVIKGNILSNDGSNFNYSLNNSRRTINYLDKEGRILREYD